MDSGSQFLPFPLWNTDLLFAIWTLVNVVRLALRCHILLFCKKFHGSLKCAGEISGFPVHACRSDVKTCDSKSISRMPTQLHKKLRKWKMLVISIRITPLHKRNLPKVSTPYLPYIKRISFCFHNIHPNLFSFIEYDDTRGKMVRKPMQACLREDFF